MYNRTPRWHSSLAICVRQDNMAFAAYVWKFDISHRILPHSKYGLMLTSFGWMSGQWTDPKFNLPRTTGSMTNICQKQPSQSIIPLDLQPFLTSSYVLCLAYVATIVGIGHSTQ